MNRRRKHLLHCCRIPIFYLAVAALSSYLSAGLVQGADTAQSSFIEHAVQSSFHEFFDMLSIPNDPVIPANMQKNADWLEKAFQKRGFSTKQLPNNGKPMVFAEYSDMDPQRKTILFYMHFDGMPVLPDKWAQKSPYSAVLKQRNAAGEWETFDSSNLFSGKINPEWRIFARSASDDKGSIMMFLAAMDALRESGGKPKVNIKVFLDSEEETGSPSIGKVMRANLDVLKCDGMVIHDGNIHPTSRPTLVFGNRGIAYATLTVFGAKIGLHSGQYGNYSPNPAQRLARLLASMKDDDGRVTIPGYYSKTIISEADRGILAAVPDDEVAIKKRLGIARTDSVANSYQEALQYPSLNVRGMASAAIAEKVSNVVPDTATAELDLRTTPEADAAFLCRMVEGQVIQQGYHLVKGKPTDEERARYDKIASFTCYETEGNKPIRSAMDTNIGGWAYRAMKNTFKQEPVRIRMMGGTVPTAAIVGPLNVPFVIIPFANTDNNQHTHNENIRLANYINGVHAIYSLLNTGF